MNDDDEAMTEASHSVPFLMSNDDDDNDEDYSTKDSEYDVKSDDYFSYDEELLSPSDNNGAIDHFTLL